MGRKRVSEEHKKARIKAAARTYYKEYATQLDYGAFVRDPGFPGITEGGTNRGIDNLGNGARKVLPRRYA